MKKQYKEATTLYKQEIQNLKNALPEAQNHAQAIKENARIVLQTNREQFSAQLKTRMDKGWGAWAAQTAELHTYLADWENRKKEGRGFYKLNDETVATVREDLAKDYRELAEQHSEELTQLLDDFGESQEELLDRLIEIRGEQHHTEPGAEQEIAEPIERQPNTKEATTTHESTEGDMSTPQPQPPMSLQSRSQPRKETKTPMSPRNKNRSRKKMLSPWKPPHRSHKHMINN